MAVIKSGSSADQLEVDATGAAKVTGTVALDAATLAALEFITATVTGVVSGAVAVSNFPATQPVSGAVSVSNLPGTQPVSGTVSVSNFPATQPVSDAGGSLTVDGAVSVTGTVGVSGSVEVVNDVGNPLPISGTVAVSNLPGTQPVSGTVAVSNLPGTQPVSGTVSVSNFPATQPVSGSVAVTGSVEVVNDVGNPLPVSGTVSVTGSVEVVNDVGNPLPVSGTIAVSNFPATQPVSGTVAVSNQPPQAAALLAVTAVGASGAAVTATLPAVSGQFHYLTYLEVILYSAAARTGVATPVTVTTTNLPGTPAHTFPSAGAIGTVDRYQIPIGLPLRSAAANVATTIACPAITGAIWRVNAHYYTAP